MPFSAFILNAKMTVATLGYIAMGVISFIFALIQPDADFMLSLASFAMIAFVFAVFCLEFLVMRLLERMFGDTYSKNGYQIIYNFTWSNVLIMPLRKLWHFIERSIRFHT